MTLPEQIRAWVEQQFNAKHVDKVTAGLIDVAAGNRRGNAFERRAVAEIMTARHREYFRAVGVPCK